MKKIKNSAPIVIIGMHRSGTTMLTKLLEKSGIDLGNDFEGNSEPKEILRVNDRILKLNDSTWCEPYKLIDALAYEDKMKELSSLIMNSKAISNGLNISEDKWGWKEPRTTITLPVWRNIFPDMRLIHVYRHPADVMLSLFTREMKRINNDRWISLNRGQHSSNTVLNLADSFKLWKTYTESAFSHVDEFGGVNVKYEDILNYPESSLKEVGEFLDVSISGFEAINKGRAFAYKKSELGNFINEAIKNDTFVAELYDV